MLKAVNRMNRSVPKFFVADADDYHEFVDLQIDLERYIGIRYEYEEIDAVISYGYVAVFWHGIKPKRFIQAVELEHDTKQ
jgi:hypothetical protein